jgi:carboxyl-terminal processing protease
MAIGFPRRYLSKRIVCGVLFLASWYPSVGKAQHENVIRCDGLGSQSVSSNVAAELVSTTSLRIPPQDLDFAALGREVLQHVESRFYRPEVAKAWADKHRDYAVDVQDRATFAQRTKNILKELNTSHTDYYTPDEYAYFGIWSIFHPVFQLPALEVDSIGVELDADHFVRWVLPGGPADRAGIRRGSQIVSIGTEQSAAEPFQPVHSLAGKADQQVILNIRSALDGPLQAVTVTPKRVVPKQEWLEAQRAGAAIEEVDGRKIGYVSMYSCAGQDPLTLLRELLGESLRAADGLILDFRFGWGGCPMEFINLFNRQPAILEMRSRDGQVMAMDAQWRKPVVLLINGGSRSGKEAVAYSLKKHGLARLVGERTAGAVVAGSCFRLSDDSILYLAVSDVLVDGERLEGVGVTPDVTVVDNYRFNGGRDEQRERAVQELLNLIKTVKE